MRIEQSALEVYRANRAKGFYDTVRPVGRAAWLVVCELAEATEALREDKFADVAGFNKDQRGGGYRKASDDDHFVQGFLRFIKDSFQDEIADAVIRMLDQFGEYVEKYKGIGGEVTGLQYVDVSSGYMLGVYMANLHTCFGHVGEATISDFEWFFVIAEQMRDYAKGLRDFRSADSSYFDADHLLIALYTTIHLARSRWGIDVEWHIEQKLRYNALRPHKHGKKY